MCGGVWWCDEVSGVLCGVRAEGGAGGSRGEGGRKERKDKKENKERQEMNGGSGGREEVRLTAISPLHSLPTAKVLRRRLSSEPKRL